MHLARRSLLFLLTAAPALAVPRSPALEAQTLSEPLALICEAAQQKPIKVRIDYEHVNVNGVGAKFTHDQISWQVTASNGATEDFNYNRNSGMLTDEIKPPATTGRAPAAERPAAAAVPGPSYHCRRAD